MKVRKTYTLNEELARTLEELRWANRIESESKTVELVLRRGLSSISSAGVYHDDKGIERERADNNRAYRAIQSTILKEHFEEFVVIAKGRLLGFSRSLDGAVELLKREAPDARHAVVDKPSLKTEAMPVWEALLNRLK